MHWCNSTTSRPTSLLKTTSILTAAQPPQSITVIAKEHITIPACGMVRNIVY
jgi:hypothetical protein